MREQIEIETKFSVSETTALPDLSDIAGVAGISNSEVHVLSAVYFDTTDLRLTRSKITLRRRTGGNDAGWHIKFPGAVGRKEIQAPLDSENNTEDYSIRNAPKEIMGQIRALIQGRDLVPIAQVDNKRSVSYLVDDTGTVIAEFCDDNVSTVSYLPGGARKQWREWEFELSADISEPEIRLSLLESAAAICTAAGAFLSDSPSKLVSALGESINHVPALPSKAQLDANNPANAVLNAIESNVAKITEYDPKVRADEYDSVHQMRVATRELRSHMQTFEGILGGSEYLNVEKELKGLASVLGRARDAEVIEERLQHLIESEIGEAVDQATKEELFADLNRNYQREHARVIRTLDSSRYADLLQALEDLLVNPPLVTTVEQEFAEQMEPETSNTSAEVTETPESSPTPLVDATSVLLEHLAKAHKKVAKLHKKAVQEWSDPELPISVREENFHNVRKAIKKLRYSAEAVGKATDVKTKSLYRACSKVQSILGDFQDAVTSRDELLQRAEAVHRKGKNSFAYGVLFQHEQSLSRKYLEGYADAYKSVKSSYKELAEESTKKYKKK